MDPLRQHHRAGDPLALHVDPTKTSSSQSLSGLSLNIFNLRKKFSSCLSNCRSIEVTVIYPLAPSSSGPVDTCFSSRSILENSQMEIPTDANQERPADLSPTTTNKTDFASHITIDSEDAIPTKIEAQTFPFLNLPLELRLKIYGYLLPPRAHTIVTQIPHNGYFYNTATIPSHSATSFYPFGRSAPSNLKLTTYKVLNANFRSSFPAPSIHPSILRVSHQIHDEAEPVLYGHRDTSWEFGIYIEAVSAFWGDRSPRARACVRNMRIAREIHASLTTQVDREGPMDERWKKMCSYVKNELVGLRDLDLVIWSSTGGTSSFPSTLASSSPSSHADGGGEEEKVEREENERKWREWQWTRDLLNLEALKNAKITYWGFHGEKESTGTVAEFDGWLAGRMVGDRLVRDRMVREGVVNEGVVVLSGRGLSS